MRQLVEVTFMSLDGVIDSPDLTREAQQYFSGTPAGSFHSDVAELMKVEGAKIGSLSIYFDTAPFPK